MTSIRADAEPGGSVEDYTRQRVQFERPLGSLPLSLA